MTANYLKNLFPTSANSDKSPEEAWTGHRPDISHLRTFRCLVYVHIPSETRAKLDQVSFQGIFVGYHSSHQYQIYNPKRRRVEWHTSIKFLEHIPGGRLLDKHTKTHGSTRIISPRFDSDEDDTEDSTAPNHLDIEQVGGSNDVQHQDYPETVEAETENSNSTTGSTTHTQIDSSIPTQSLPTTSVPVRRSTRERKPYDQYGFDKGRQAWKVQMDADLDKHGRKENFQAPKIYESLTYKEAIRCKDQRLWKIAILDELRALIFNNTWNLTKLLQGRRLIFSKWVFKVKYTSSGLVDRYKA